MELITVQQQLEEIIKQIGKVMGLYHQAKTDYENLDEFKKPTLALCEIEESIEGRSQSEITRRALAHPMYKAHIESLNDARKKYNYQWARLKALEVKLSCLQSINKYLQ